MARSLAAGTSVGHYTILAPLGAGGMGEVYRAHDTTLNRDVALKVLTEASDSDLRLAQVAPSSSRGGRRAPGHDDDPAERMLREARASSALNHPHICTIHEIGEADDRRFIVMEYVEGKPLSQLIAADGLPPETVIRYGTQIADALAHAHDHGILHRDLKSANVIITPDAEVKLIDFGIAVRLPEADAEAVTRTQESPVSNRPAGTLAYMAPEVLNGRPATARSDIWSLGVLLYEMTAGRLPFEGETPLHVVSAIARDEPRALPRRVSAGLRSIVERCLQKEPGGRYASAAVVQGALEMLHSDAGADERPAAARPSAARTWRAAAVIVAAGVGLLVYVLRPEAPATSRLGAPRLTNPIQITSAIGVEDYPAWSRDSQMLAYVSRQDGNPDIWVTPIGGQPLNRTADYGGEDLAPAWSPDGREIAFLSERDEGGLFAMPALAGAPRRIASFPWGSPTTTWFSTAWLAEGAELASVEGRELKVVTLRTGEARHFDLPRGSESYNPMELNWSADERYVAYWVGLGAGSATGQIWVRRQLDGVAVPVTDFETLDVSPSWAPDGRALYFVSNRGGSRDLWRQRLSDEGLPEGAPERISAGVGMWHALVSPDGGKVAYVRGGYVTNVWRVPLLKGRPGTWADAEQLTFDEVFVEGVDVSPDGSQLLISSDRSGNSDLWTLPVEGGEMQQLTTDLAMECCARWSLDGEQVTFYGTRSGNRDIWVAPSRGGPARQLTRDEEADMRPSWSPDGREVVFQSRRSGSVDLWTVNVDTGDLRLLVESGNRPLWSPDGQWIAYHSRGSLWRVSAEGGEPEQLTRTGFYPPVWSADGTEVYFERSGNYWAISLADRSERPLTAFEGRLGHLFDGEVNSTDGRYLYYLWESSVGDIWVADLVWDDEGQD